MIILSIGRNTEILQAVSSDLNRHGFKATWTNHPESASTLFNGSDLDLVAFGNGLNARTRLFIKKIFSVQNPSIIFVDGMAPIPSLLADQVRHTAALASGRNGHPLTDIEFKKATHSVDCTVVSSCKIQINLFHLSLLYEITEKTIADTNLDPGNYSFSIDKKNKSWFGSHFIVVRANDKPLFIAALA